MAVTFKVRGKERPRPAPPAKTAPKSVTPPKKTAATSAERAAQRSARMVTDVTKETRAAIRGVIERAIREGMPPYDAARLIRGMVGLNLQQAQAMLNFRAGLIDLGLRMEQVDRRVEMYVARKIRERALLIARTEIYDALNAGKLSSWREALRRGVIPKTTKKRLVVAQDERTCPVCAPLYGQTRALSKPFETSRGPRQMPPFHPRCRCTAVLDISDAVPRRRAAEAIARVIPGRNGQPDQVRVRAGKSGELLAALLPDGVHVQYVHVTPRQRKQGVGKELYEALGDVMRQRKLDRFLRDEMIQPQSRKAVERMRAAALERARRKR